MGETPVIERSLRVLRGTRVLSSKSVTPEELRSKQSSRCLRLWEQGTYGLPPLLNPHRLPLPHMSRVKSLRPVDGRGWEGRTSTSPVGGWVRGVQVHRFTVVKEGPGPDSPKKGWERHMGLYIGPLE